jgi:histone H3/H4
MLIPRRPFSRLVKEIMDQSIKSFTNQPVGFRLTVSALAALQEATEQAVVLTLEMANHAAIHAKRVTVMPRDIHFIRRVMGMMDPSCWLAYVDAGK